MDRVICKDEMCNQCSGVVVFAYALSIQGVQHYCLFCESCDWLVRMGVSKAVAKKYALGMMILPRCYSAAEKERMQAGKPERSVNHWDSISKAPKVKPYKPEQSKKVSVKPAPLPVSRLRSMPYADYLQTSHWKNMRQSALSRADHRCQLCNATGRLDVHHRTYERRGCEKPSDLTVLCRSCHAGFHGKES